MEYFVAGILLSIAITLAWLAGALIEFTKNPRITVFLSETDRDLLTNFRRRKPKAKELA